MKKNQSIAIDNADELVEKSVKLKKHNKQKKYSKKWSILSYIPFLNRKKKKQIAILRLEGVIGKVQFKSGLTMASLNKLIENAFKNKNLDILCISLNCPGGSPVQTELIANKLRNLADKNNVKIYCFVEDVAASGGYWLASIADKIFATKSSVIGSIGVVSSGFGFVKAIEKLGIERRVYTQGDNKSVLDPFVKATKEDISIISNLQKNIHQHFIDQVKSARAGKLTQGDNILFNGLFWTGETALKYGLIDEIGDLYSFLDSNYDSDEINIEYIEHKQGWLKSKFGLFASVFGDKFASSVSNSVIDQIESKIEFSKYS